MNVTHIALARDNANVIYVISDKVVRKSSNGGDTFFQLSPPKTFVSPPRIITVAPDSSDVVAVVDSHAGGNHIWLSTNGGNVWNDIGAPKNGINAVITDVAISPAMGPPNPGRHYFAAIADNRPGVTTRGDVMMKSGNQWTGIGGVGGTHDYMALQVSPEYLADQSICAVGATPNDGIDYQIINFAGKSVAFTVKFVSPGTTTDFCVPATPYSVIHADIAMGIDVLAADERVKVAFISVTTNTLSRTDGVYRVFDQLFERLSVHPNDVGLRIRSIDYDGEVLLAGEYETTNVWICLNPLTAAPAWDKSTPPPSGEREAVVGMRRPNCYVGTSGGKSGFFVL